MQKFLRRLKDNIIYTAVVVILISILITSFMAFRNQVIMKETQNQVLDAEKAIERTEGLHSSLQLIDLGLRGFAIGKTQKLLDPYKQAAASIPIALDSVRAIVRGQKYSTVDFEKYAEALSGYLLFSKEMVALAEVDSMEQFKALLIEDRGFNVWQSYMAFSASFIEHQKNQIQEAKDRYAFAVKSNAIVQVLLLILCLPSLFLIYYRIRIQDKRMKGLLLNLEENNRKYVFDPGTALATEAVDILNSSIQNSKNASYFIKQITSGNFGVSWPGLSESNESLNKENLSGILLDMRDQMKRIQDEDRKRIWTTEGLTKFTEIIRQHQDNVTTLSDQSTRYLVKYLNAQQGATFVLQEDLEENQFLELNACYAFDKKKFVEKKVDIGQGMIGQAFMEGSTINLKAVPAGYTHITSGLGEATPSCVLIVPMKYNEKIEGVLELAGFTAWQDYQITFAEKATEYMAAAITSVRSTQKMKTMVEQMQSQTQQLHAQEEEMRQNMEELSATNEEMKRKETEYIEKLRKTGISVDI